MVKFIIHGWGVAVNPGKIHLISVETPQNIKDSH